MKRRDMKEDLPYPKRRRRLPVVLSPEEVQRLIAGAKNLYHRTLLLTLYGAGLRRSEVAHLKVRDIDSQRMLLRVDQGKGGRDREVPLSPTRFFGAVCSFPRSCVSGASGRGLMPVQVSERTLISPRE